MARQYSIKDIAKYKAGSGYGDWIANLQALQSGSGPTQSRLPEEELPPLEPLSELLNSDIPQHIQRAMTTYMHYIIINLRVSKFRMDYTINEGEEERTIQATTVVFEITLYRQRPAIIKMLYKDQGFLQFHPINDQMTRVDFKQVPNVYQHRIDFQTFILRNFPIRMWTTDSMGQDKEYVTNRLQEFGLLDAELQEFIGLRRPNIIPNTRPPHRGNGYEGGGEKDSDKPYLNPVIPDEIPQPNTINQDETRDMANYVIINSRIAKVSGQNIGNRIVFLLNLFSPRLRLAVAVMLYKQNGQIDYRDQRPITEGDISVLSQNFVRIPEGTPFLTFVTRNLTREDAFSNEVGQDKNFVRNRLQEFDRLSDDVDDFINSPPQEGSGLLENWVDNHLAEMYKFNNTFGIDGLLGSGYDDDFDYNLKKNILSENKMKKKNYDAMHREMFGTGMDMDMEGEGISQGISEWMSNLSKLFKLIKIRATM